MAGTEDAEATRPQREHRRAEGSRENRAAGSAARATVRVSPGESGRETGLRRKETNSESVFLMGGFHFPPYNFLNFPNFCYFLKFV